MDARVRSLIQIPHCRSWWWGRGEREGGKGEAQRGGTDQLFIVRDLRGRVWWARKRE